MSLGSGKMSPGYNTLPEFNKPKTGWDLRKYQTVVHVWSESDHSATAWMQAHVLKYNKQWQHADNWGFEGLIGDQAPLGFWDPLGLAKDKDVEVFKRPEQQAHLERSYRVEEVLNMEHHWRHELNPGAVRLRSSTAEWLCLQPWVPS